MLSSFCIVWFRILDERSAWLTSSPATLLYLCHNEVLNFLRRIWDRTHEANNNQDLRMKSIWICIYAWVDNFFSSLLSVYLLTLHIYAFRSSDTVANIQQEGKKERGKEMTAVVQCLLVALNAKQLQQNYTHRYNIQNKKKEIKITSEQETPKEHKYLNKSTVCAMHYGWTDSVHKIYSYIEWWNHSVSGCLAKFVFSSFTRAFWRKGSATIPNSLFAFSIHIHSQKSETSSMFWFFFFSLLAASQSLSENAWYFVYIELWSHRS